MASIQMSPRWGFNSGQVLGVASTARSYSKRNRRYPSGVGSAARQNRGLTLISQISRILVSLACSRTLV